MISLSDDSETVCFYYSENVPKIGTYNVRSHLTHTPLTRAHGKRDQLRVEGRAPDRSMSTSPPPTGGPGRWRGGEGGAFGPTDRWPCPGGGEARALEKVPVPARAKSGKVGKFGILSDAF